MLFLITDIYKWILLLLSAKFSHGVNDSSTETSLIITNGNPNLASELCYARGRRFTQPFTNNYALQSRETQ